MFQISKISSDLKKNPKSEYYEHLTFFYFIQNKNCHQKKRLYIIVLADTDIPPTNQYPEMFYKYDKYFGWVYLLYVELWMQFRNNNPTTYQVDDKSTFGFPF